MEQRASQKKRAFIYCRTSDDSEQEDGTKVSIETQEESGRELANRHGYQVLKVFKDRNRSGRLYPSGFEIPDSEVENYCNECNYSSINRTRKEFGELLRRIKEIEVIIVRRADRLMRPLPLSMLDVHILSMLKKHNVIIHSHDDNIIDPHDPAHITIFKIKSTIQSDYVSDRREETKIAIRALRDEGKLYFPPSFYGFRSDGHQKVKRIPDEIQLVENIYKDFLSGTPLKAIARQFNDSHIPTIRHKGKKKDGKGYWLDSTIRSILKRTQYAGFQYKSNGTDRVDVPAFHPPVIPYETFKKVQDKLEQNRQGYHVGNTKAVHALAGLVYCGYCGYKLYTTATYMRCNGNQYKMESLRCITPTKTKEKTPCEGIQVRERFPKGLKRRNGKPYTNGLEDCLFPLIYKGYINHLIAKSKRVDLDVDIEECESLLERNEDHKKSLGQKLRDNRIDDKTFDLLIKDCMEAGSKVQQKLAMLQKEANTIDRIDVPSKLYADFASHELSNELKRRLFHNVIERVDIWHDRIKVLLKGGAEFTLNRVRRGKTYILPSWRIVEMNKDSYEMQTREAVPRIKYKHTEIREDTKIDVVYEYDNAEPQKVIYGDQNLVVMTVGTKVPIAGVNQE